MLHYFLYLNSKSEWPLIIEHVAFNFNTLTFDKHKKSLFYLSSGILFAKRKLSSNRYTKLFRNLVKFLKKLQNKILAPKFQIYNNNLKLFKKYIFL